MNVIQDINNNHWLKMHIKIGFAEQDVLININNISVIRMTEDDFCKVIMNTNAEPSLSEFEVDKEFINKIFGRI